MRTEIFTYALAAAGTTILFIFIALSRKRWSTLAFSAFFAFQTVGAFLLGGQSSEILAFSARSMILFAHFCIVLGIRLQTNRIRPRLWRFWAYALAWAVFGGIIAFIPAIRPFEGIALSLGIIVMVVEFLLRLHSYGKNVPFIVRVVTTAVGIAYLLAQAARTFVLAFSGTELAGFSSLISPPVRILFLVSWTAVLMLIDTSTGFGELVHRNAILSDLAGKDALTGLPNRYQMDLTLSYEIERSERYGHPLSMVIFDLDDFKRVNDTWGHAIGDSVLKVTAETARSCLRESDGLFRWGGEEFVIVAPDTGVSGTLRLAEKVRSGIAAANMPSVGKITASFGVSERLEGENRDDWFERADFALYQAKNAGKNRVVASTSPEEPPIASIRLEWKEEWSSGDPRIDIEHRRMVAMAARLINASLGKSNRADLAAGIKILFSETKAHFRHEEEILAESGYPDREEHARLHADLLAKAETVLVETSGGANPASVFFDFLVDKVLIGHMLTDDVRFFPFLKTSSRGEAKTSSAAPRGR